jgi:xanthine dehydrogenase accessory factor
MPSAPNGSDNHWITTRRTTEDDYGCGYYFGIMMEPLAFARTCLLRGQACCLLLVVAHRGSTPGRTGFRMVVAPNELLVGSIGGGMMEHKLVELARHQLRSSSPQILLKRQVHRADVAAERSGMICSGEQTVLLLPLEPLRDVLALTEVAAAIAARRPGHFAITAQGFRSIRTGRPNGQRFTPPSYLSERDEPQPDWCYEELFDPRETINIIGAGHVGLACCELLSRLDFRIRLFDDRPDLNTLHQNTFTDEKILGPYENLGEHIPDDPSQYAAIMTFGYRTDDVAVRRLLPKPLRYLGLMGSEAKVTQLLTGLRADGFPDDQLARLYAPIGLPIHSKTPAEIAVSVASEIIRVRNSPAADSQ